MNLEDIAPTVGIAAAVALVLALVAPYALLTGEHMAFRIGEYYAAGPVNVVAAGFLALLGVIAFLAGTRGNTDPDVAAGACLALGIAIAFIAVGWALSVPSQLVDGFQAGWMDWHRWIVVMLAFAIPASAGGYASEVL